MSRYLLDTNHLSKAIGTSSAFRDRLHQRMLLGDVFGTCFPVLCELEVGIRQTHRPQNARGALNKLLPSMRIWPIDWSTINGYADAYRQTVSKGHKPGFVDLVVAAIAADQGATILTTDRDFEALPDIKTENWVA